MRSWLHLLLYHWSQSLTSDKFGLDNRADVRDTLASDTYLVTPSHRSLSGGTATRRRQAKGWLFLLLGECYALQTFSWFILNTSVPLTASFGKGVNERRIDILARAKFRVAGCHNRLAIVVQCGRIG